MKHQPRWKYDCSRCKFSWCCGITCACNLYKMRDPPPKRKAEVEEAHDLYNFERIGIREIMES